MRPLALLLATAATVEAQGFQFDYCPTQREVILNTDVTQIQPCNGPPMIVQGGIFFFRDVIIPPGVTVRAVGSRPMIWIVSGRFDVYGTITADGEDGTGVETLGSANFPTAGGLGEANGGTGGRGSPNPLDRSPKGDDGYGPFLAASLGGEGGRLSCITPGTPGSGAGGGSFGTAGDPWYPRPAGTSFPAQLGVGGAGGRLGSLPGGLAGARPFVDGNPNNDFIGIGYDLNSRRVLLGELSMFRGGTGGGGGGDRAVSCATSDPQFVNDAKGGGGGAGGGCIVIYAIGDLAVQISGRITANGGNGGGGEPARSNQWGGGGGGGSGGMIVLASESRIELHVKGDTFANGDYDFVVSADGGVGTEGDFSGSPIRSKYPPQSAAQFSQNQIGGFGGMGIVQLMAPIGSNSDGTNTVFDDRISIVDDNGTALVGAAKQRYLGWQGWEDQTGVLVDDNGQPTNTAGGQGDIRPAPILLPLF